MKKNDGNILYDQTDILEEVEHFYCNLYKQRETDGADFSSLNAQKLSQEDSDMTEGNITAVEALATLRTMKNDKSPGSDGFTAEFYKVFLNNIETFLVRSINNGFTKEEMSVTQRRGVITCIPKEDKPKNILKTCAQ